MENVKKGRGVKRESSGEEEDFESADEGDEEPPSCNCVPPPATSADSTSGNHVAKNKTPLIRQEMIAIDNTTQVTGRVIDSDNSLEPGERDQMDRTVCTSERKGEAPAIERLDERTDSCNSNRQEVERNVEAESLVEEEAHEHDLPVVYQVGGDSDEEIHVTIKSDVRVLNAHKSDHISEKFPGNDRVETEHSFEHKEALEMEHDKKPEVSKTAECSIAGESMNAEKQTSSAEASEGKSCEAGGLEAIKRGKGDEDFSGKSADETKSASQEELPKEKPSISGGWGWGSWGSMFTQATASVTSGLSSVIESVEASLGIPEPTEIAQKVMDEERKVQEVVKNEPVLTSAEPQTTHGDNNGNNSQGLEEPSTTISVLGLTGAVELVSEGLGALEYIGKKTMDVLSEGDPGLRKKREALGGKGPNLSQVLREAKEEAEDKASQEKHKAAVKSVNFITEFDQHQGLAHLEALEILAKECEVKVESHIIDLSDEQLKLIKPLLRTIQEVLHFENDDEDSEDQDFDSEVTESLDALNLTHIPNKISYVDKKAKEWIEACVQEQDHTPGSKEGSEIYTTGISTLAELTARTVEQFHKIAEVILLITENKDTSALVRAQSLKKLTVSVCTEVSILSNHFAGCLNTAADDSEDPEALNSLITSLYLESSECTRYVQHAFGLLCPVLQLSSLDEKTES